MAAYDCGRMVGTGDCGRGTAVPGMGWRVWILTLKGHGRDQTLKGRDDGCWCIFHRRVWRLVGPPWRTAVDPHDTRVGR